MNLFLTEDGVLKLGYYGLISQAECYSIKKTECDGVRSFAPEVFGGKYEMKSDLWSLGIDRKSTRLNSSHSRASRMPSSA